MAAVRQSTHEKDMVDGAVRSGGKQTLHVLDDGRNERFGVDKVNFV